MLISFVFVFVFVFDLRQGHHANRLDWGKSYHLSIASAIGWLGSEEIYIFQFNKIHKSCLYIILQYAIYNEYKKHQLYFPASWGVLHSNNLGRPQLQVGWFKVIHTCTIAYLHTCTGCSCGQTRAHKGTYVGSTNLVHIKVHMYTHTQYIGCSCDHCLLEVLFTDNSTRDGWLHKTHWCLQVHCRAQLYSWQWSLVRVAVVDCSWLPTGLLHVPPPSQQCHTPCSTGWLKYKYTNT